MKAVTLTGATGFIGSHIAERLLRDRITTHLLVRRRTRLIDSFEKMGAVIHLTSPENPGIPAASVQKADVVIHCAGVTKALREKDYIEANVEFTHSLLKVLSGHQKFLFLSSQAAAGPSDPHIPIDEKTEPRPVSHYGRSKLRAEALIREWGESNNRNYVILRPCIVYGPREKDLYEGFKWIKKGIFFILGSGDKEFSLIHVQDLVEAVMRCAGHSCPGQVYFVNHDTPCSWKGFKNTVQKALHINRVREVRIPEGMAYAAACACDAVSFISKKPALINRQKVTEAKQPAWLCSNEKIKKDLSWKPEIPHEQGIQQTVSWYVQENWL